MLSYSKNSNKFEISKHKTKSPLDTEVIVKNIYAEITRDSIPSDDVSGFGCSAFGQILELGKSVSSFKKNDNVIFLAKNTAAYSKHSVVEQENLIHIPDNIDNKLISASYFSAMVAHMLTRRVYRLQDKRIVLVNDATSSSGYIISQIAQALGAIVIGTVDSKEKKNFAINHGCHKVFYYNSKNFAEEILELTKNYGVNIIYHPLGNTAFNQSLKCLMKMGIIVCYGNEANTINVDIQKFIEKSLYIAFPSVFDYKLNRKEFVLSSKDIFNLISSNQIKISIDSEYQMDNFTKAKEKIEKNNYCGSLMLNIEK